MVTLPPEIVASAVPLGFWARAIPDETTVMIHMRAMDVLSNAILLS
jgi:hypothetical protein